MSLKERIQCGIAVVRVLEAYDLQSENPVSVIQCAPIASATTLFDADRIRMHISRHRSPINSETRKPVYVATKTIVEYGSATSASKAANFSGATYGFALRPRVSRDQPESRSGYISTKTSMNSSTSPRRLRVTVPRALEQRPCWTELTMSFGGRASRELSVFEGEGRSPNGMLYAPKLSTCSRHR
jgi:hypothetical protein